MSKVVEGLLYSEDHEWVSIEGDIATVGITDYAQDELGEVVYVELPQENSDFESGEEVSEIESVKTDSAVYCPVSGTVIETNSELEAKPELINQDCYKAWIFRMRLSSQPEDLLDAKAYSEFLKTLK